VSDQGENHSLVLEQRNLETAEVTVSIT